jgi:hypothetical protein
MTECEYCKEKGGEFIRNYEFIVKSEGKWWLCNPETSPKEIHYCPICNRKLPRGDTK